MTVYDGRGSLSPQDAALFSRISLQCGAETISAGCHWRNCKQNEPIEHLINQLISSNKFSERSIPDSVIVAVQIISLFFESNNLGSIFSAHFHDSASRRNKTVPTETIFPPTKLLKAGRLPHEGKDGHRHQGAPSECRATEMISIRFGRPKSRGRNRRHYSSLRCLERHLNFKELKNVSSNSHLLAKY
ncbi:hypothetical protein VTO42DRAFT_599 [Malbranchea cinnamomea]